MPTSSSPTLVWEPGKCDLPAQLQFNCLLRRVNQASKFYPIKGLLVKSDNFLETDHAYTPSKVQHVFMLLQHAKTHEVGLPNKHTQLNLNLRKTIIFHVRSKYCMGHACTKEYLLCI